MTISVNTNRTDSTGGAAKSLVLPLINYGVDYAKIVDIAGEAIITNLTSPTDRPNTMRFSTSAIADIYKNSGITPEFKSPSKKGFSLLVQSKSIYTTTNSDDVSYRVDSPIGVHIVVKAPSDANITAAMLEAEVARAVRGFYETGAALRLSAMARGSLLPTDI